MLLIAAVFGCLVATSPTALAGRQYLYVGVHPISVKAGGGFCQIEGEHTHVYGPEHIKTHYRVRGGAYFFIGDPVAYGYEGEKHPYYGHHPVSVGPVVGGHFDDVEYCYLDGPHYHYWAPPVGASFELKGGAYWYVGSYPADYRAELKVRRPINKVYAGIEYQEPVVIVDPPEAWVGPVVDVHAGARVHTSAGVHAGAGFRAGVEVNVPMPVLEVGIAAPVVVVGHHHDVVYVDDHHHHKHKKWRGHRGWRGGRGHKRHGHW